MKKILLPTDFSENAWNAIKYALQLYKNEKCNFILLNTYTPILYQVEYMQSSEPQFQVMEAVKETSKTRLQNLVKKIETEFPNPMHQFTTISAFNTLTGEIDQLYDGNVMDLIIMGTKGASGVQEILFGSNTMHVLNHAKCPVIAIPGGFTFEKPHDLLFPSDYDLEFKDHHLKPLLDIAELYNIRINIMHVHYGEGLSKRQEENKQILEDKFKGIAHLFHSIKNQNIPDAIAEFQIKTRINLLVMINNKHSFFENLFFKSNIKHIGFHLNVPFMVIPS
ncbi:universal stress protein [Winogradskyella aquimaris]|uniref:Universal stress protein n=1 Tax=Winogradskyella aquimaris TaxID=864074 RepID=A0ABU5ENA2_9FLAO|nr:universal stress protein [Winogradskyella aquimaris]MDY2587931.1 universal stress protein [Winogradskyella aquimaris]